jgi:hypothetical protein
VAAPSPPPSAPAAVTLVSSTVPGSLTFPFSAPSQPGYGTPRIALTAGRMTLDQPLAEGVTATLTLHDQPPPAPTSKSKPSRTTVNGRPATAYEWRYSDDDPSIPYNDIERTLVWQPTTTGWLALHISPARDTADLVAYAERVTPTPSKAQAPFTFGLMPSGWHVDNIDSAVVTFCPPDVTPDPSYVNKLAVMLDTATEPKFAPSAEEVQVAGRQAWLTTGEEGQTLQIPLDNGTSLLLQLAPKAALPRDVLLRFAATIAVTPAAQPGHG